MYQTHEGLDTSRSLWNSSVSYISENPNLNSHQHDCYKIAVSLDHSIDCYFETGLEKGVKGFVVNKGVMHKCAAPDGPILNNLVEPNSAWGRKLGQILDGKTFVKLEQVIDTSRINPVLPVNHESLTNEQLFPHIHHLFQIITQGQYVDLKPVDVRIDSVLKYIEKHIEKELFLENVIDQTFLSTERTRHLFSEQMGMPFSRYVLWQRIRKTLYHIIRTQSRLSQSVTLFGFTDLSHFNRVFKSTFGFNPSTFLRECRVIV